MNIAVVSYSYTGNSTRFAEVVAKELAAEHIRVQTKRPVNYGTITLDLLFQRSPEIDLSPEELGNYDLILLVGPVWMGWSPSRCAVASGNSKSILVHTGSSPSAAARTGTIPSLPRS
jgi:multimeric flavodoxin WrbA